MHTTQTSHPLLIAVCPSVSSLETADTFRFGAGVCAVFMLLLLCLAVCKLIHEGLSHAIRGKVGKNLSKTCYVLRNSCYFIEAFDG